MITRYCILDKIRAVTFKYINLKKNCIKTRNYSKKPQKIFIKRKSRPEYYFIFLDTYN